MFKPDAGLGAYMNLAEIYICHFCQTFCEPFNLRKILMGGGGGYT